MSILAFDSIASRPKKAFYRIADKVNKIVFLEKLHNPSGYTFLLVVAVLIGIIIVKKGILSAIFLLAAIFGIPIVLGCLLDFRFGLLFAIFSSFFVFLSKRLITEELPSGMMVEMILVLSFFGIILKQLFKKDRSWRVANNEISYVFLANVGFVLIEVLNPEAGSVSGYLFGIRKVFGVLIAYYIALFAMDKLKFIYNYTALWLGLALFAGLWGMKQEWFGLAQFEWEHIVRTEGFRAIFFQTGNMRKFSFLSDPTSFGIFMAFASIVCYILMLAPFSFYKRVAFGVSGTIMLVGMAYSGTRTAYAMVPIGILIFVLMTITNRSTLIFAIGFLCVGSVIIFGPIYGNATINRIRTVFRPSEDESYKVRDNNRASIQPYIHSHPMGGGISTSGELGTKYCPDHRLAGFPPDSGYLRTALEIGWIGLILTCWLFFTILKVGIQNFYRTKDAKLKYLNVAYVAMFYSIIVANYSQESIGQIPAAFVFYPSMALLARLKEYRST